VTQEVKRNYLEITSLEKLKVSPVPLGNYFLELLEPSNFQIN